MPIARNPSRPVSTCVTLLPLTVVRLSGADRRLSTRHTRRRRCGTREAERLGCMLHAAHSRTECRASAGGGVAMRRLRGCCACPLGEALHFALSGDGPHAMLFVASPGRVRPTARPPMTEGRHWVDTAAEGGGRSRRADEALNGAAQRRRRVCDSRFPTWHRAAAGCNDGSDKPAQPTGSPGADVGGFTICTRGPGTEVGSSRQ
jgi:hypothetical protein